MMENTFGVLASRFHVFRRKIENIKHITKAAVILHNFLMKGKERGTSCPPNYVDQETGQGTLPDYLEFPFPGHKKTSSTLHPVSLGFFMCRKILVK